MRHLDFLEFTAHAEGKSHLVPDYQLPFCSPAMAERMSRSSVPLAPKRSLITLSSIVCCFMIKGYCAVGVEVEVEVEVNANIVMLYELVWKE